MVETPSSLLGSGPSYLTSTNRYWKLPADGDVPFPHTRAQFAPDEKTATAARIKGATPFLMMRGFW